jgi:hypothetical protein
MKGPYAPNHRRDAEQVRGLQTEPPTTRCSLARLVVAAKSVAQEKPNRAVSINHITVKVPDVRRTSNFYHYQEFFGIPLKQHSAITHILGVGDACFFKQGDDQARVDHYDFGIAGFDADDVRTKLSELNLTFDSGN